MTTQIEKITGSEGDIERIEKAARLVESGALVAFPTETVYGVACKAGRESVDRLSAVKGRAPEKHYTLHVGQVGEYKTYVPKVNARTEKLLRHAWPGPLTMVFDVDPVDLANVKSQIGADAFEILYRNGSIGIRCPDHVCASMLLRLAQCPVVAPSANLAGRNPAIDADQAATQIGDQVDLILDAGPCKYGTSSTVAKVGADGITILREGVYSADDIGAMAQIVVLFVCTGNTCRSAMAEGLFRMRLAKKLGCDVDALEAKGYKIMSAGTMQMGGAPASNGALTACHLKGADIGRHVSQHLTRSLVEASDFIFGMTQSHCDQVRSLMPEGEETCSLLVEDREVPDPIGQSQEFFNRCADIIETAVKARIGELIL